MTWKRLVVLIAALLCTTWGASTVHGQDIRQSDLLATIEALGVCGPVHRAVLDLAPRTADGSFDTAHTTYEVDSPEISSLFMYISAPERFAVADQVPAAVRVFEIGGTVQGLAFYWPILDENDVGEEDLAIVEATAAALSPFLGEPETADTGQQEWSTESLTIRASQPSEDSKATRLLVGCTATEETYLAAREAAEPTDTGDDVTEASDEDGLPSNPWLDRSVVDVLLSFGPPDEDPSTPADNIVGLHYTKVMGPGDVPTEWWWWFIDGKAVYAAGDFLPPKGSKSARSSYEGFRQSIRGFFGEPAHDGRDPETGTERVVYETGPQIFTLTYLDPDGDPWFRVEVFDATQMDALPDELRPNRSLPERFSPPPPDTGVTREDMGSAVGAG